MKNTRQSTELMLVDRHATATNLYHLTGRVLESLGALPEPEARKIVRSLAILFLRPEDCDEVSRILKGIRRVIPPTRRPA